VVARRTGRVYWRSRRGRAPAPDPVVVKDLDGRVLEVREADTFKPQPPHAA
jgi:hypothetical protein